MRLSDHQGHFTADAARLIMYANSLPGHRVRLREVTRPDLLQRLYVKLGKSWKLNSWHLESLALDLLLDIYGAWQKDTPAYLVLGVFWEDLSPYNRWGGRFGDGNHFERRTILREEPKLEA
jgi:hypothetical protein